MKAFLARYDGRCVECGGDIAADFDMIVMTDDGAAHEECVDLPPEPVTFAL